LNILSIAFGDEVALHFLPFTLAAIEIPHGIHGTNYFHEKNLFE